MATWSKSEYLESTFGARVKNLRSALKSAERAFPHKTRSIQVFRLHYKLNSRKDTAETVPFSKIAPKFGISIGGAARMSQDVELLLRRHPELWPEE